MHEITAPREFSPFEEICTLTPFIECLSREFKDVACESCFKRNPNLVSCKACLDAKYCGKDCQENDWKNHKLECQKLKNLPLDMGNVEADTIRLLGNTILKIKGKDWKSIKINILGIDVVFDHIEENLKILDLYQHLYLSSTKEACRRYIGDENMPNDEDFKKILGKVRNSLYHININEYRVKSTKVLFGSSLFATECIPNCYFIARKDSNIIKSVKKIEKSEKLSLSRLSLFGTADIPGITPQCNCTECRLPYGESVLSKITKERKAVGVINVTRQFISTWKLFGTVLRMPDAEYIVDGLLEGHKGVLGDTNALHLKVLDIKCFEIEGDPLEVRSYLLKLEKNFVAAFGECHPYLSKVYSALFMNYLSLGQRSTGMMYLEKARNLEKVFS